MTGFEHTKWPASLLVYFSCFAEAILISVALFVSSSVHLIPIKRLNFTSTLGISHNTFHVIFATLSVIRRMKKYCVHHKLLNGVRILSHWLGSREFRLSRPTKCVVSIWAVKLTMSEQGNANTLTYTQHTRNFTNVIIVVYYFFFLSFCVFSLSVDPTRAQINCAYSNATEEVRWRTKQKIIIC